jgi:hypothetical protein
MAESKQAKDIDGQIRPLIEKWVESVRNKEHQGSNGALRA